MMSRRLSRIISVYLLQMDSKDTRLYDDEEIGAILKRASQIQGGLKPETETELSLEELETLASESGIAPRFVKAAATDLEQLDDLEDPDQSVRTDPIEKRSTS